MLKLLTNLFTLTGEVTPPTEVVETVTGFEKFQNWCSDILPVVILGLIVLGIVGYLIKKKKN